jgi:hypothetical protein
MPVVFKIYNEAGKLQLDANAPSLQFKSKLSAVASFNYERTPGKRVDYAWNVSNFPLIAVRPSGGPITQMGLIGGGSPGYQYAVLATGVGIDAYVFERPYIMPPPSGPRLVLYDAAGAVTYSSAQRPMRIAAVLSTGGGVFPVSQFVGTPGRIYAAAFPGYIGYFGYEVADFIIGPGGNQQIPEGETWYRFVGAGASVEVDPAQPHKLFFGQLQHSGTPHGTTQSPPAGANGSYDGTVLIVDVTGI